MQCAVRSVAYMLKGTGSQRTGDDRFSAQSNSCMVRPSSFLVEIPKQTSAAPHATALSYGVRNAVQNFNTSIGRHDTSSHTCVA